MIEGEQKNGELVCLFTSYIFKMCDNEAYLNDSEVGSTKGYKLTIQQKPDITAGVKYL